MSSTKRYMKFVKPYTGQIIGTLIIGLIKFAIPLLIPVIIQYVIDDIVTNQHLSVDEKTSKLLITMSIMLGVFVVLRPPIEFYRQYFAQWTSSKILYDIRDRLFTHLQKLSFKFYSNTRAGKLSPE